MSSQRKLGTPKKPAARARLKKADTKTSKTKAKKAVSVPILRLPPEIVLLIDELLELHDRLALGRANRHFYSIINPVIYRDNVKRASASSLFWGAENGQLGTLKHALAAGADLNASGPPPRKAGEPADGPEPDIDGPDVEVVHVDPGAEIFEPGPSALPQPSCTALHLAAKNGHRDIVEWLLDNGADIDAPSYRVCDCKYLKSGRQLTTPLSEWPRWRALHTAMCSQEREVAELLIFRGASLDLDATPGHGHTALHSAAAHGLIPVIKLLALNDVNLDVNQPDAWDNTALHYVSELWSPRDSADIRDTITKLLALGADLEAHNESGYTPLLNACARGNFAVAYRLVGIGANPDPHRLVPNFRDYRPLYFCMLQRAEFFDVDEAPVKHDEFEGNRVTLIKALVDAGADVNARFDKRGHRGVTPLMLACELAEPRAVAALVQCGAEINAQDRSGRTPLCYAVTIRVDHRGEVPEIATILLRHGARMDLEEEPNCSPLDTAIKHVRWADDEVLEAMLRVATRHNLTEAKLKDALRSCASCGNHKALRLLLDFADRVYGVADADVRDYLDRIIQQNDPWNQIETFDCMMDFGRPVYTNETLLKKTIEQHNRELSLAVLARGVAVSEFRLNGDRTYLHLACEWGDVEVVKALLERGADVDVFDRQLHTPLSIAVIENNLPVAVALMKEVADPFLVPPDELFQELYGGGHDDVDYDGGDGDGDPDEWRIHKRRYLTAFDIAIRRARLDILRDMLARYTLPDVPPGCAFSYVHRAATQSSDPAVLRLLLAKGADPLGGPGCPPDRRPAVRLLRAVWGQDRRRRRGRGWGSPDVLDDVDGVLEMAKMLLEETPEEEMPAALLREIASAEVGDDQPERKKIKEVLMGWAGYRIDWTDVDAEGGG